jgi:penicillin-binding protein 1A
VEPADYDDTTLGFIPMRRSLYESRNLSTIKLGMQIGEAAVIGEARRFGITTPIPPYPSIHIGSAGVRPIEMIASYSAFATLGTRVSPIFVLRVEDRAGTILWQPSVRREEVLDPAHAWLVTDMLRDVVRRGTAFSAVWRGGFTLPSGGKTGTTDDHTDAWYIGFTPEIVAGIWVGYDFVQRIMDNAGGGRIVAPAWASFMRAVYDRRPPPQDWNRPDALVREVDRSTGFLATRSARSTCGRDWFFPAPSPVACVPCIRCSARRSRPDVLRIRASGVRPVTAPPIVDGAVLVDGDRIVAVGPHARSPARRGASSFLTVLVLAHQLPHPSG